MPEISRFFGMVIRMYFREHHPAHFHVVVEGRDALIGIETFSLLKGRLSPRQLGLVVDWAMQHQQELKDNWERAQRRKPLAQIDPLE